ncbi:unnamed protein product [Paramecium sonneborni]|uniref:Uncharacterized protein n=1 Tax=Paramecium sonneborni TaxID=65129 RepID=A0A8S1P422_9CILI|nr:unnamed protein product [Paramecium sonneborni]
MDHKLYREEQQKIILKENIKKNQVKRLNDKIMTNYQIYQNQRKRRQFWLKRELCQPLRLDALAQHQKRYEEEIFVKLNQRQQQKLEQEEEFKMNLITFPKSQTLIRSEEEQAKLKIFSIVSSRSKKIIEIKIIEIWRIHQRQFSKRYSKYSISPIKQKQEQYNIQKSQLDSVNQKIKKLQSILSEKK